MAPLMIAGTALQAIGTISSGMSAAAAGKRNQFILDEQARQTDIATADQERVFRDRSRASAAATRASMLANGIDPTSGSGLDVTAQSARDAEMDALTLRYEGLLQSRSLRMQGANEAWKGKQVHNQSFLSASGQLLSGAGQYYALTPKPKVPFYGVGGNPY